MFKNSEKNNNILRISSNVRSRESVDASSGDGLSITCSLLQWPHVGM